MNASASKVVVNAMSVDVEDYFQVSAFEQAIPRSSWDTMPCHVEANVERLLALFAQYNVKATFFTLGWIAERYPVLVKTFVEHGHEVASHGWEHTRVFRQSPDEFRQDVTKAKALLEDLAGQPVRGYRAASYSINTSNLWALDVLAEAGYEYSSSVVPIKHDLYGMPEASRFPFRAESSGLLEIPISTITMAGRNVNCGGGGWFRLFPYTFSRWAIQSINDKEKKPCVFYFHPWEIDENQPRVMGIGVKSRFRHYVNIHKMYGRVERLLSDFNWDRMDRVFLSPEGETNQRPEAVSCC